MNAEEFYAEAKKNYDQGDRAGAAALFEQARAAYVSEGNPKQAAQTANDLGVVYYLVGRADDARQSLQAALNEFEKLGDVLGQAKATGNLAQLQNRSGDQDTAEKNYWRAAELFREAGERGMEFDTWRALSQMQLQRGRWVQALDSYDHGLAAQGGTKLLRWFLQIPLKILHLR